jgi:RNA polymerase primary sigma factor
MGLNELESMEAPPDKESLFMDMCACSDPLGALNDVAQEAKRSRSKFTPDINSPVLDLTYYYLPQINRVIQNYRGLGLEDSDLLSSGLLATQEAIVKIRNGDYTVYNTGQTLWASVETQLARKIADMYNIQVGEIPTLRLFVSAQDEFEATYGTPPDQFQTQNLIDNILGPEPVPNSKGGINKNWKSWLSKRRTLHQIIASTETESAILAPVNEISGVDPERLYLMEERRLQVLDQLKYLSGRELEIIIKRLGLDGQKEMTLEEIASDYGITRERIRKIEAKIMRKLRHPGVKSLLQDYPED